MEILNEVDNNEDLENSLAENIAMVEYYYHVQITPEFPLMKRLNMQEHLQKMIKIDFDNMTGAVQTAIARAFK